VGIPLFFILSLILSHANAETLKNFRSGSILFSPSCDPKAGAAGVSQDVCAGDPVAAPAATSYMDLLKQIYPDLRADGSSSGPARSPRKNLGQMDLADFESAPKAAGPKSFLPAGDFAYLTVGNRTVILDRVSGWLAYFQLQPSSKLLDLVGIAQDQHVTLATDIGVYSIDPNQFLFWTVNSHHNAGESYSIYNLIHAGSEKADIVYDGPFLYSFLLYDSSDCRVAQSLAPVRKVSADPTGFPRLAMNVDQEKVCEKGEKPIVAGKRHFDATLLWEPAKQKYMGGSKELFRLNGCRIEGKTNCGV